MCSETVSVITFCDYFQYLKVHKNARPLPSPQSPPPLCPLNSPPLANTSGSATGCLLAEPVKLGEIRNQMATLFSRDVVSVSKSRSRDRLLKGLVSISALGVKVSFRFTN